MKKSAWIAIMFCIGCSQKPKPAAIHIKLVNDNQSVEVKGLNIAITNEIARDSSNEEWQNLIPVYRMPTDTGMKNYQPVQSGTYQLQDSAVIFTPDTPFIQGKTYFMRYYLFGSGNSAADFIKGRKRLGETHYTDLTFR
jgi:hypothetical protein